MAAPGDPYEIANVTVGAHDKRVERSKTAVLSETYRQLIAVGMSGVSIDDVSRNSGVAKTTIYRHWPSRSALLIDACSRMGGPQVAPNTGSLRQDVGLLATTVAEQLRTAAWPSVLPSIIDAAERDPVIATMQSNLHDGNMAPFRMVAQQARQRGEMAADSETADLIAAVLGPLFYRRWFSKETIDDDFVARVVNAAVNGVTVGATTADTRDAPPSSRAPIGKAASPRGTRRS